MRGFAIARFAGIRPVHALVLAVVVGGLVVDVRDARARSAAQPVPDGAIRLVSKDVGDERWAIALDTTSGVVTGNVYRADGGAPQFLWCWPQDASSDPLRLRCEGTTGCDIWVDLGEVELPASFFAPRTTCEDTDAAPPRALAGAVAGSSGAASGLRVTPDQRRTLISKDVGGLRWSMVYDHETNTLTGNVLDPSGGAPQFVACSEEGGAPDVTFGCSGTAGDACAGGTWTALPEVALPWTFLNARRCPAAPEPRGLVATLAPSRPGDIFAYPDSSVGSFGNEIAVDGDVAVVGVAEKAVYVFERDGSGWREAARIAPIEPSELRPGGQQFARGVAVANGTVVATDDAKLRVFERRSGAWTLTATLALDDPRGSVASPMISGRTIAFIAASSDRTVPAEIHVYDASGGAWRRSGSIRLPGEAPVESWGATWLDGDRLVAMVHGGGHREQGGFNRVSLVVHDRRGRDWSASASLPLPEFDLSRSSPTLASSGDDLVIGAPRNEPLSRFGGYARVVALDAGAVRERAVLDSCAPDVGRFARVVALSAGRLAIAAPSYDRRGGSAGEVHLYERSDGVWKASGRLRVGDAAIDDLALDGTTLVVGSGFEGTVRVFDLDRVDLLPPAPCPSAPAETWPGTQWTIAAPQEHGMNPLRLARAGAYALAPGTNTQGVVVVRHGAIVAEWYEDGRDADSFAASWSMAKSVAGAVVGIAIDQGLIASEAAGMAEFFPEWRGTPKDAITLRNVLQMSSGLLWNEYYATNQDVLSDIAKMASQERDQLTFAATKPLELPPGSHFAYSSGDSMLLSGVLEAATGVTAGEYARRALFDPIGMAKAEWWSDAVGHTLTYCCIDAPSREFARFGLLYARDGRWRDRQLIPRDYYRESLTPLADAEGGSAYGYQWWLAGWPNAEGYDGQHIYVVPELDLVVVRNGHYDKDPGPPIADPNLFARYPAAGLGNGRGTVPAGENFDVGRLVDAIVSAVVR